MITSLFFSFLFLVYEWSFGFLPTVTEMPNWYDSLEENLGVFSALGQIPIIGTVIEITLLVATIYAGWQGVVFVNWVYNKIRGSG